MTGARKVRTGARARRLILLAAFPLLVPVAAAPESPSAGVATTSNSLLSLSVAGDTISIGVDQAESERGQDLRGFASFIAGKHGTDRSGVAERSASNQGESGSDAAVEGSIDLPGVSATLVDASVDVSLDEVEARAASAGQLASVSLLDGLIDLDGLTSTSVAVVDDDGARVHRTITLDGLELLNVGSLLDELGIDPYAIGCDAIEYAGAALSVNTAGLCEAAVAADAAMTEGQSIIAAAELDLASIVDGLTESVVQGDRDDAAGIACPDPVGDPVGYATCAPGALAALSDHATQYAMDVSEADPTDVASLRAAVLAGFDVILTAFGDLAVVQVAIVGPTCDAAIAAIDDVIAGVSEGDPSDVVASLADAGLPGALSSACAVATDALGSLLSAPLLTLGGVSIEMNTDARPDDPTATVTASIGAVTVGLGAPIAVGVEDAEEALAQLDAAIDDVLGGLLADLGIGFSLPVLELLVIETATGQHEDGDWFADAGLTLLRITVPPSTFEVPEGDERPLSFLDEDGGEYASYGAIGMGAFGFPTRAVLAAPVGGPEVVAAAVVFEAGSSHTPAGAPAPEGGSDPEGSDDDDDDGGSGGSGSGGGSLSGKLGHGSDEAGASGSPAGTSLPRTGASVLGVLMLALATLGFGGLLHTVDRARRSGL